MTPRPNRISVYMNQGPAQFGAIYGLAAAIAFGVFNGLAHHSIGLGVLIGAGCGSVLGTYRAFAINREWRGTALSPQTRAVSRRAVQLGLPAKSLAVAEAVIEQAQLIEGRDNKRSRIAAYVLFGSFTAVCGNISIHQIMVGRTAGVTVWGLVTVVGVFAAVMAPRQARRAAQRARTARQAAEAFLAR